MALIPVWEQLATDQTDPWQVVPRQDLHRLTRRIGTLTNNQASVCDVNWDNQPVDRFWVDIKPNSGYYEGGTFRFMVILPSDYESDDPPTVVCQTHIYHPNIDTSAIGDCTNVCINVLDEDMWKRKYGLECLVKSLVYLVKNPNIYSPLVYGFDATTKDTFERKVKKFMKMDTSAASISMLSLDDDDSADSDDSANYEARWADRPSIVKSRSLNGFPDLPFCSDNRNFSLISTCSWIRNPLNSQLAHSTFCVFVCLFFFLIYALLV